MPYPSLAEEITDLIHHRLQRADRHERGRILESALTIYSRTGSVVAFFRDQPIAFYHERSGRAFTLHGIPVELEQCELAPIPRIPYLDQVLEEGGDVAPQHGRSGRAPPPCSYDSKAHGWTHRRPSGSSTFRHTKPKDTPSAGHRRRDGYDRFSRDDRFTYDDRSACDDRFTRDDHFDYDDRFTRAAGRAASRAAEDDARHQFERTYGSDYFTDRRGPEAPRGHYAGFPDRSESFGYNTSSRGPAASSGYSTNTSYRHVDPSGFHTETRGPSDGSSAYSSSGFYAGEPRRPAMSSGYPGASSFYNTETRGPSSGASGYSSGNDSYSYNYAGGGGPRGRPASPKYNTETRGPGRSSSPDSNYSGSGGYSSSSSNYDSRPPPRAQPQPQPHPHPREPPANGSMADRFEWLLKRPFGFYEILGVDRGASEAQIKKAYRKLALVHHPDKHSGGGAAKAEAHRRFQAINEANETLSDARKKHAYDGNLETSDATSPGCTTAIPGKYGHVPPDACNSYYTVVPDFNSAKYCWVLITGAFWETASFALRALGQRNQQSQSIATLSQFLLLLSPLWINAFAYMTAGRLIHCFSATHAALGMPATRIGRVFVWCDVVSFVVQAIGGLLLAPGNTAEAMRLGLRVYMVGVGVQEVFIVVFAVLVGKFHWGKRRGERGYVKEVEEGGQGWGGWGAWLYRRWELLTYVLYAVLVLITIRIMYRLIEFARGFDPSNKILYNESYLLYLDGLPMLLAVIVLAVVHPGMVLQGPDSSYPKRLHWWNWGKKRELKQAAKKRQVMERETEMLARERANEMIIEDSFVGRRGRHVH
ncbi:putative rta1 domain protein [Lasiodiplodia theobromae]|uniref:Rta1 domain protein n=1 Tax=Lasiodiplodia theobromae TaxID=45133 RepID=A0A8H7M9V8_9PEZI|nr:putative rta1 domain protein [Lasiodiplodia theobromae]